MFKRRDYIIALLIGLAALLAAYVRWAPGVCGTEYDDGIYVANAKALAEGLGYSLINLPGAPPQTKYPILYPAILAALWKIYPSFPANLILLQGFSMICGALAAVAGYLYLVRFNYCSRLGAATAALLWGTSPWIAYLSARVLPDSAFTLVLILAFWIADKRLESPEPKLAQPRWKAFLAGFGMALPFLFRTLGGVILPGILFCLWRKRLPCKLIAAGMAAATVPWCLWSRYCLSQISDNAITRYYTDYVWLAFQFGFREILNRVVPLNIACLCLVLGRIPNEGLAYCLGPVFLFFIVILDIVVWLTIAYEAAYRRRMLPLSICAFAVVLIVWPWYPTRYIVPLLMFIMALFVGKCEAWLGLGNTRQWFHYSLGLFLAVSLIFNIWLLHKHYQVMNATGYPYPTFIITDTQPTRWEPFQRVNTWLKQHATASDIIAADYDPLLFLYTDRHTCRPMTCNTVALMFHGKGYPFGTSEELARNLSDAHAKYLVYEPMTGSCEDQPMLALFEDFRKKQKGRYKVAYQDTDPRFVVLELMP